MAGFHSPLFVLGISGGGQAQAGFRTPLPVFPAGAVVDQMQAGFRTALPLFPMGAIGGQPPSPIIPAVGRSSTRRWIDEEEILAVIMAIDRNQREQ